MKNNFAKFLFFVFFLICTNAGAQTITTVESRCVNTGEVIFSGTVGAGGPYQLSAIIHPLLYTDTSIHISQNLPYTFAALYPGTYTFKVTDQRGTDFIYPGIVITSSYIEPGNNDYIPVTTNVTNCSVPNGTISGTMTNGRAPFTYSIMSGPVQVGTVNTTGTFTGLPAGVYRVQAADSCQNIQTRDATITGNPGALSITGAFVSVVNCTTVSLDSLKVLPSFPSGGFYEIINYNGSGGSIVRASGNSIPVNFNLFFNTDIQNGRVTIKVYDTCGHVASYIPIRYTNYIADTILAGVINRIGCDRYSLDALTVVPALRQGAMLQVTNAVTGIVYNSPLPVHFTARATDISTGNIIVKVIDSCGNISTTNQIRIISNYWNFTPDFKIYCSTVVLDSINITGFIIPPYVVRVKALFRNTSGAADSTSNQVVTSFPYIIAGITGTPNPLTIRVEVTDSCGEVRRITLTQSFVITPGIVRFANCSSTTVNLSVVGKFVSPVTYNVSPNPGLGTNTNGHFELPDGTYTFTATDSCGKVAAYGPVVITRPWQLLPVEQIKVCTDEFVTNKIPVPIKSIGQLTIRQYSGGMPVTNASTLVSTQFFTSVYNGCVTCRDSAVSIEKISFDNALPGQTYSYVVSDSCGNADTVSVINSSLQPFDHHAFSKTKCIRGSDIYASWRSYGNPANTVVVHVLDSNGNQLFEFDSDSITNINTYPNGQILRYDVPPGRYSIKYSFVDCPQIYIDTVFTEDYVQPKITTVQSVTPCGAGGTPVIITGADGIDPYQYQIINSYPDHYTSQAQTSAVFTLPISQSTVTVRIVDACLNSSTRTIAVTRASSPAIHINPALLSTCTLPFTIRLFTDSVYAGSVFEWTKLTGTGAGPAVIGRSVSLTVIYNSIADTGTYKVRVTVPGTCFDTSATYTLKNVIVSCIPGIAGNVFDDGNGLTDGIVNGAGTNAGGLNAVLINAANTVIAVSPVSATGTYSFPEVAAGTYSMMISTTPAVVNNAPPATTLPPGWVNTGEHIGALTGNDGVINGKLGSILIDTVIISELNFGIERLPVANDIVEYRSNPGGSLRVPVPVLTGSDAEDGMYDGISGINTIIIQSLPPNAVLYYNSLPVSVGQSIINYNPSLLTIDPLDNIPSALFTFSEVDAAMQVSLPDTVLILFTGLPVTITNFTATASGSNVKLNWTVEEQLNILHYTVQHSTDGYNFKAIGVLPESNIASYYMLHTTPANGLNYYRLKITESDGKVAYSSIARVRFNTGSFITSVQPNPFTGSIYISMELQRASAVKIILYDAAGKKVYQNIFSGSKGANKFTLNHLDKFSKGVYIMNVLADDFIFQHKILKE